MPQETRKFLDSYAIIEIIKNNPRYAELADVVPVSTRANLVEVAYHLLRDFSKEKALKIIKALKIEALEIQESQVAKIAAFRIENAKKKFSYIDCIGYVLAMENRISFVTGDRQFEGMPNVEFVK
ncbi:MAG: PIN domain-containing protein [Candidatus Diapherotrites archaeon]|nr:PIN domain-containing protein [Candidatus Diapherotrites archaeon]